VLVGGKGGLLTFYRKMCFYCVHNKRALKLNYNQVCVENNRKLQFIVSSACLIALCSVQLTER
jgi:hypothetical protein